MNQSQAEAIAQRQLDAYNAGDIDAFELCYTEDVELYTLTTHELTGKGRSYLRQRYGELFTRCPDLHAALVLRSTVGNVVFDRELVTGTGGDPIHAMAVYEVNDEGLIAKAWFVKA